METTSSFSTKERVLPYNFLAERLVLGSVITNPEAILIVSQYLNVPCFYKKAHQVIYKACLILHGENKIIDFITLSTWLQDNNNGNYIEDLSDLADFLNEIVSIAYLEDYIALIYEKYLRRLLIELGNEIIQCGYLTEIPLETLFSKIEEKFYALQFKKQEELFKTSSQVLSQILDELREKIRTNSFTYPGLTTSFEDLDSLTQGFQNSDLIIIAGRPSMGKTAFSLNLAKNIALEHKLGVAFFSLEMSQQQLLYRLLGTESLVSPTKLRSGRINKEEWILINHSVDTLSELPIFIDDSPSLSVSEMHFKLKNLKQEYSGSLGLIFIDYLQLLEDNSSNQNRVQEISKITRNLKKLARELNLPIVVLSQLSRNLETRTNKRPLLSDLRDSGSIEQDADLVMMLYRDDYYNPKSAEKNSIEVIVAKQRNGPLGTAKLGFNSQILRFYNFKAKN